MMERYANRFFENQEPFNAENIESAETIMVRAREKQACALQVETMALEQSTAEKPTEGTGSRGVEQSLRA
jgi:hypothetical protein